MRRPLGVNSDQLSSLGELSRPGEIARLNVVRRRRTVKDSPQPDPIALGAPIEPTGANRQGAAPNSLRAERTAIDDAIKVNKKNISPSRLRAANQSSKSSG